MNDLRGRQLFSKSARLLCRADFQRVFDKAERSTDQCFTVLARTNQTGHPRLGLAITKKLVRNANQRNRIKRIIRESFRQHQHDLGGLDFIVLGRSGIAEKENPELFASLARHWSRLVRKCAES